MVTLAELRAALPLLEGSVPAISSVRVLLDAVPLLAVRDGVSSDALYSQPAEMVLPRLQAELQEIGSSEDRMRQALGVAHGKVD